MTHPHSQESIAYHAARLLLLIQFCGKPQGQRSRVLPGIEGRTLLAKLDFFIRYPAYLSRAAQILRTRYKNKEFSDSDFGLTDSTEPNTVESRMVRYLYGPWDFNYYVAIAYLVGKDLIHIEYKGATEVFRLTSAGQRVATQIAGDPAFDDLVKRAKTTYHIFNKFNGNRLKTFIYNNFPEVVNRRLREPI